VTKLLRVLVVEDSEDDALLMLAELTRAGYAPDHRRVQTEKELREALAFGNWDVILSDFTLPQFSGGNALSMLRKSGLDIPFIIVSGSIGEDAAVAAMKAGAHDYVMKINLGRLVPAVEREIREAQVRHERRKAEEELAAHSKEIESLNERLAQDQAELATFHDLVTHDVSNFSMTLLGMVERLLSQADGKLTPMQMDLLRRVNRQGWVVSRLSENARMLARMRKKGLTEEPCSVLLSEALSAAVESLRTMHFDRYLEVRVEDPPEPIRVGVPFLEHLLLNLLDNAVRQSSKWEHLIIWVKVCEQDDLVNVSLRSGSRLEEDIHDHLFERSCRGDRSTGAGLGLVVVREIVERVGGKVWASHLPEGQGGNVEIVLTLPKA
jgi:signal transduction histidine kinase